MLQQDDQGWNRYADTSTIPSNRSEIGCVELCNFHFCCAFIFCPELLDNDILGRASANNVVPRAHATLVLRNGQ